MPITIEPSAPSALTDANLQPRGAVFPSPVDWRDQVLYFLLPDRFSDGGEAQRPLFDRANPAQFRVADKRAWMAAGKKFQGGTLKGIASKLDYLKALGVTALWVGPIWRQRPDLETYHGYGIQNFLDVDPRFGTRQDLRDLVDAAHARGIYVLLDIIYNHSGNNWFYAANGSPRDTLPYRFQPPYAVHGWRSGAGQSIGNITTLEDGAWPDEHVGMALEKRSCRSAVDTAFLPNYYHAHSPCRCRLLQKRRMPIMKATISLLPMPHPLVTTCLPAPDYFVLRPQLLTRI